MNTKKKEEIHNVKMIYNLEFNDNDKTIKLIPQKMPISSEEDLSVNSKTIEKDINSYSIIKNVHKIIYLCI
jgi:hypothetical protein